MGRSIVYAPAAMDSAALWFEDRRWVNIFPQDAAQPAGSVDHIDPRAGLFAVDFATSPVAAMNMENAGAGFPVTFVDSAGAFLQGGGSYRLNLPTDIPTKAFWSVSVYDAITGAGLDNGQAFPSINSMDRPMLNADGSTDIYFGPVSPGRGKNWLRTLPDRGFFVVLRLYAPTRAFLDQSWKPGDLEKLG
jgi:hypothetical protein